MKRWPAGTDAKSLFLVRSCRRDFDSRDTSAPGLDSDASRAEFIELASRHGVLGLSLNTMLRAGALNGASSKGWAEAMSRALKRRAIIMHLERDQILAILADSGLDVVVLKGAGLASTVFRTPSTRDYGDIDILLPQSSIDDAVRALAAHGYVLPTSAAVTDGYRVHHFHFRVERAGGAIVELHWALTQGFETYSLDAAAFLARAAADPALANARVPCAEHALLHIVIENVRDWFTRLTRVVDIDRIVTAAPDMDWDFVVRSAREGHFITALALALDVSETMLGTAIPERVKRQIRPSRTVSAHLAMLDVPHSVMRQHGITRPSWGSLLRLWLLDDRSRVAAAAGLWTGADEDPLEWMWLGKEGPEALRHGFAQRFSRCAKIAGYQLATYARTVTNSGGASAEP